MSHSTERISTTHVGSLPRPEDLLPYFERIQAGEEIDEEAFEAAVREATEEAVRRQEEVGIDVATHGEQGRLSFVTYVVNRLTGFEGEVPAIQWADLEEYPEYARQVPTFREWSEPGATIPAASGPIEYDGEAETKAELDRFEAAIEETGAEFEETFVTAAAPGTVAAYVGNTHYDSHEEYLFAVADAIATEYELIADSGATLQIDAPDLLGGRHLKFKDRSESEFVEVVATHVEALNEALANVPAEQVRIHTCWGNYEGPHHHDISLETVLPEIYEADVGGLLIEQANPCHQHDYTVFEEHGVPDRWQLIPGVIDVTVNYIEPPAVIADRIERFVDAVGDPDRILAGADCGLGTFAGFGAVHPEIAWKKLDALADGAKLASERVY
ncbi:Methionine synthase II (cobalamin-independent) [Halalkaliarchaeum sp. AArc-CO]|uniref:cobalamin-independent methionine synthase II family protein n=1 Tax=unclassified Halalkaliarchaeum TaxID=2678344 RepID=UPI00217D2879|nr:MULTISPECIES: cobalamin-independent methionine synthase II family protein [unclassified Halalkaliarchaeum]MDR5672981.1 cobalamin-independent methionine synthase II family protein [Halalkaliarchaeum sp. AArc-GB]UWG50323.1 Methionine synthase II (cobalamin-independent) [Halalkaliarchaeum sp. AArc-CO]